MESTPRFARLTTVLRPSPRLPPVTTAIFAAEIPSFLVAMLFVAPFSLEERTAFGAADEDLNSPISCLFLLRGLSFGEGS